MIKNIKLLTIILLALAILFNGHSSLFSNSYSKIPFYFGFSGGMNYSKVNYDEVSKEYLPSGQIAFEIESFVFSNSKVAKSSLLYGLSYESKNYNILNLNNKEIQLESSYLTIPIKYQYNIIDLMKDNSNMSFLMKEDNLTISILIGGFYSLLLNQKSSDENIDYLPSSNYGIIIGSKLDYMFNNGINVFIEYNLQYGFASLQNSVSTTTNISHIINIGFKFPSTALF